MPVVVVLRCGSRPEYLAAGVSAERQCLRQERVKALGFFFFSLTAVFGSWPNGEVETADGRIRP